MMGQPLLFFVSKRIAPTLTGQGAKKSGRLAMNHPLYCRGTVTRTQDPLVPNQMR